MTTNDDTKELRKALEELPTAEQKIEELGRRTMAELGEIRRMLGVLSRDICDACGHLGATVGPWPIDPGVVANRRVGLFACSACARRFYADTASHSVQCTCNADAFRLPAMKQGGANYMPKAWPLGVVVLVTHPVGNSLRLKDIQDDVSCVVKACETRPDVAIVGPKTYEAIKGLFLPVAGFSAINIDGCLIHVDPTAPEGNILYMNSAYCVVVDGKLGTSRPETCGLRSGIPLADEQPTTAPEPGVSPMASEPTVGPWPIDPGVAGEGSVS